jgi:hypothetical protein
MECHSCEDALTQEHLGSQCIAMYIALDMSTLWTYDYVVSVDSDDTQNQKAMDLLNA